MRFFSLAGKAAVLLTWLLLAGSNRLLAQTETTYDTVSIGGIRQIIAFRGNSAGPLILFLHGGPGSSRMRQADQFTDSLRQHCLVVQWDQRGAGFTEKLNPSTQPVPLRRMEQDAEEIVHLLLEKFNRKKLYLAGESWGTVPGFYMAYHHPELLEAYLVFSPVVQQVKSETLLLNQLKQQALDAGNRAAISELQTVHVPFAGYRQLYYLRKWMFHFEGQPFPDKDTAAVVQYLRTWANTWLPAWNEAMLQDRTLLMPSFKCPIYFFIGGKDRQTNAGIAQAYYKKLKAPRKDLFVFPTAGHSVLTEQAAEVQRLILRQVLPTQGSEPRW